MSYEQDQKLTERQELKKLDDLYKERLKRALEQDGSNFKAVSGVDQDFNPLEKEDVFESKARQAFDIDKFKMTINKDFITRYGNDKLRR